MLVTLIIFSILAIIMLAWGYSRGQDEHLAGLKIAGGMLVDVFPINTQQLAPVHRTFMVS